MPNSFKIDGWTSPNAPIGLFSTKIFADLPGWSADILDFWKSYSLFKVVFKIIERKDN